MKADGSLERYKAWLVAKGYNKKHGVDFDFSPIVKLTTVRCLISAATHHKWPIYQLDVNNSFLHGALHEDVYMKVPEGLTCSKGQVCKLQRSLYGLKQASRQWFSRLVEELIRKGFTQSKHDYSLFIKKDSIHIIIIAIYVDDMLVTGNNPSEITNIKLHLDSTFCIKDLGVLHYFLGIEVIYSFAGIILTQHKFTKELLPNSGIKSFKTVVTPHPLNLKLLAFEGELLPDATLYRSLVEKLNYLTNTKPDLSYTTQHLS